MKLNNLKKIARSKVLWIISGAFVLRIVLSFFGTLDLDFNTFVGWASRLREVGFAKFYESWSDYLPGYLYFLWALGKLDSILPIARELVFKFPAIAADLITGYFIYKIVKNFKDEKFGLIALGAYVFNPAILANSALWGQIDSLTALFSVLAIYFLYSRPLLSAVFLSFGTLIKLQTAFVGLVVVLVMIVKKWDVRKVATYVLTGAIIFVISFIPFSFKKNLVVFIFERISLTFGQYPYTSVNAFNFWGLSGLWQKDTLVFQAFGFFITLGVSLFSFFKLRKKEGWEYKLTAIVFLASFLFFTRFHERHLLPALAPILISSSFNPFLIFFYLGFSATYLINLYYSYIWISNDFLTVFSQTTIKAISFLNLTLFSAFFFSLFTKSKTLGKIYKNIISRNTKEKLTFSKINISRKILRIFLIFILGFSLVARLVWIYQPNKEYFDEVYHAFTARRILHGDPKAWEWWNTPPEGFAYEWTHPPLAKLGMVAGMFVFGENAFGWRFPGALLGVLSVLLVYLIAKKIFKDELVGILSAAVFSLDGLPLVMSRIGMNDIYLLTFGLASLYLFLIDKNFLSAVFFGLAVSSKWSAAWLLPILFVSHFVFKKKVKVSYIWFVFVPPAIYLATYIPMFLTGHDFETFIGMQKQMWWYHTSLKATHGYTSAWWSWPLMLRPIWLYTKAESGYVSNIYAMGNPAIFWFGLFSILLSFWHAFTKRIKKLGFLIFSYLVFFVPWALSPRIMFLYHYLPSIPFLAIISGFVLRKHKKLIIPFAIITFILFVYFFPHLVGLKAPSALDSSYYWFSSWK